MTDILGPFKTYQALILSLTLTLMAGVSCSDLTEKETQKVSEALSDSLLSSTETWDLDMTLIEEGLNKVRVQGSYAETFNLPELKETRIRGPIHIDVFDSTGAVKTVVKSNRAVYKAEESVFELYGNVRVDTRDSTHLESEYLKWNQSENQISTPKFVYITTPTDTTTGSDFTGSTDLNNLKIRNYTGSSVINKN